MCLNLNSVLNVKVLEVAFNQEKTLVGASSPDAAAEDRRREINLTILCSINLNISTDFVRLVKIMMMCPAQPNPAQPSQGGIQQRLVTICVCGVE